MIFVTFKNKKCFGDNMLDLSIILPTYNEVDNILPLINSLKENLKEYKKEIIVVDDNSPDGTGKLVEAFSKRDKEVKCIIRKDERGLASAILTGLIESSGDVIIFMDTDFSHPPERISGMLKYLEEYDVVFASRYVEGGEFLGTTKLKYVLSLALNKFIKFVLQIPILDSTSGFFAAKKEIFEGLKSKKIFDGYGDYCFKLIYYLKNKNVKMKEIPFTYKSRIFGRSKTLIIHHGVSYVLQTLKLRLWCLKF